MAFWDKLTSRGHVEDRRGMAPATAGGIGLTGLALYLLLHVMTGSEIDIGQVLGELQNVPVQNTSNITRETFDGQDEYEVFAATVLGSVNDAWREIFRQSGKAFEEPRLVLFRSATESACGTATSDVGPHYCPLDRTIYLDETFFEELRSRFGARGGDVAEAYVIAHEVAHHAQNELGIMDEVRLPQEDNAASVRLELQADCFAGLWAHSVRDLGVFEANEIVEAMDAASAVGDDRIQERVTGRINPETWTHGSSQDRVAWFTNGYESGNASDCDPFGSSRITNP